MDAEQQHNGWCIWASVGAALALATPGICAAADVFLSISEDGIPRYATQALDPSYRIAYKEFQPNAAATAVARGPSSSPDPLHSVIDRVSLRHGVSAALVQAVAHVESKRNAHAVSPKGARGVMQLMPATAERYGLTGSHSWRDPERNIDAGVRHLKDLLSQHQGNVALALAAYNAGAGAVARHQARIPPYRETMLYVPAVLAKSASISAP